MWQSLLILVFLLLAPVDTQAGGIELVENSTKRKFDRQMAIELYQRVQGQIENRRLPIEARPRVQLHLLPKAEVRQVLLQCTRGGCGHVLRLKVRGKKKRLVFLGISEDRVDLWMNGPYQYSVAHAIIISFDYVNRLYLEPDVIHDITVTAWRTSRNERRWKVTAQALRDGR